MILVNKKVYLTCAPPAAGKTTFITKNLQNFKNSIWISRDEIRFSFLKDGEDYFLHEKDVFDFFIKKINIALEDPEIENIFIDATHLNKKSRNKTLSRLKKELITELNCIVFTTPLKECLIRNSKRQGRAQVPSDVIIDMFKHFTYPSKDENFDKIWIVNENGEIDEIKERG